MPGIAAALQSTRAPVVAVSPIVGGDSVKGPTAKLMRELGMAITNHAIIEHYGGLLDALLVDTRDHVANLSIPHARCDTLMLTLADRVRVAGAALALAGSVR